MRFAFLSCSLASLALAVVGASCGDSSSDGKGGKGADMEGGTGTVVPCGVDAGIVGVLPKTSISLSGGLSGTFVSSGFVTEKENSSMGWEGVVSSTGPEPRLPSPLERRTRSVRRAGSRSRCRSCSTGSTVAATAHGRRPMARAASPSTVASARPGFSKGRITCSPATAPARSPRRRKREAARPP